MPTAKTYINWPIVGDTFEENGRMYVKVINPKTNKEKVVRWYSDREYSKMYNEPYVIHFNAREAFGFCDEGYITLFSGDKKVIQDYFVSHPRVARYNTLFQWFIPSEMSVPTEELQELDIMPVTLPWSVIAGEGNMTRPYDEVQKIIEELIGPETNPYNPCAEVEK